MMKTRAILVSLAMAWLAAGQIMAQGIPFEQGNFQAALAKAEQTGKLLFVDAYAKWCGPCKWMAANGFQDPEVGAYFKEHFIAYQYDMEVGGGPVFAQVYSVKAYPTLFFLKGDGSVVTQQTGALDAAGLLKLAKETMEKYQPPMERVIPVDPTPSPTPAPDPMPAPNQGTRLTIHPEPDVPQYTKEQWGDQLSQVIDAQDEDAFMKLGELLVMSDEPDRDWMFVVAQRKWLESGGDKSVFVENLFFWAETSGTEDADALNLAADLILENVDDPSLWGFAELWKAEAKELVAMKGEGQRMQGNERVLPELEEGENALPAEGWGEAWVPVGE